MFMSFYAIKKYSEETQALCAGCSKAGLQTNKQTNKHKNKQKKQAGAITIHCAA